MAESAENRISSALLRVEFQDPFRLVFFPVGAGNYVFNFRCLAQRQPLPDRQREGFYQSKCRSQGIERE